MEASELHTPTLSFPGKIQYLVKMRHGGLQMDLLVPAWIPTPVRSPVTTPAELHTSSSP
jgi:hypothetical protein